jgi:hypothetical protein
VIKILNSNYAKFKSEGLDIPKYLQTKKIMWHKECKLPMSDKNSIGQSALLYTKGKGKRYTQELINEIVEMLQDGINPITRTRIMEATGLSEQAVKRYWKPFKNSNRGI